MAFRPQTKVVYKVSGIVVLSTMFFLSRWFSGLLARILSTTGWLLGLQGQKSIDGQDVESGQHVVPRGVVGFPCRLAHQIFNMYRTYLLKLHQPR